MKTIAINRSGAASIRQSVKLHISGAVSKIYKIAGTLRVALSVAGALVCYAGATIDSDPLLYTGAFIALAAIRTFAGPKED